MSSLPQPSSLTPQQAAIYCRVSTLEQSERGYSLDAQAEDCRKLADELGAAVVAEYRDTDSGASWDLPGLNALLDAAKRHDFDLLIVYDPDRLARRMAKQLVLEDELSRAGVAIRYVTLRLGDSAEDNLLKNVRGSIAEYERAKIAFRTSRGRRAKAERGLIVGVGVPPYGYQYERDATGRVIGLEPDPETAPVVQRIFRDLARKSVQQVCDALNAEGIPTYRGGVSWQTATIQGIAKNPTYLGTAYYGRRDSQKHWRDQSQWLVIQTTPLVTRAEWDAAHDGLKRRRYQRQSMGPTEDDPYTLRGLLICGHCGGPLACTPNNGYRYYTCLRTLPARARKTGHPGCDLPAILAEAIEADTWLRVSEALLDPGKLSAELERARDAHADAHQRRTRRLRTIDREIEKLRARLARVTTERLDARPGSETERALRQVADETEQAIAHLQGERAELSAMPTPGLSPEQTAALEQFASQVRQGLEKATSADRRTIYQMLQLQGRVRLDADEGVQFNPRRPYRFSVNWDGCIEVPNGDREHKKIRLKYFTPDYAEWEAKYLHAASA